MQDGNRIEYLGNVSNQNNSLICLNNPIKLYDNKFKILIEPSKYSIFSISNTSGHTYFANTINSNGELLSKDILLHVFTSNSLTNNALTDNITTDNTTTNNTTTNNTTTDNDTTSNVNDKILSLSDKKLIVKVGQSVSVPYNYSKHENIYVAGFDKKKAIVNVDRNNKVITVQGVSAGNTTVDVIDISKNNKSDIEKINVTVEENIAEIPQFKNRIYTGQKQSVTAGEGYKLSGTTSATNAGSYSVTAKLNNGYKWSNGSTKKQKLKWQIEKVDAELLLSDTDVQLKEKESIKIYYKYNGDGKIKVATSKKGVVKASINTKSKSITLKGDKAGTVAIKVYASSGKNYNAVEGSIVNITVNKK